jgi:CubicO group peptidase (beta-lactamase class C family)
MRRALPFVAAAALLVVAPVRANEPILSLFRDYLESLRLQAGIPGLSAALVGRDEIIWEDAFGYSDVEGGVLTTPDTPFHLDGLTALLTTTLVLDCVERGLFSLDTPVGQLNPDATGEDATIRELLSHTSGDPADLAYRFQPERLDLLPPLIRRACRGDSFRETLSNFFDLFGMFDSVPGPDVVRLVRPAEGIPSPSQAERYARTLTRLAIPYAVNAQKRATRSTSPVTTLTAASGLITTVRDFARFDLALKRGDLLTPATLAGAWQAAAGRGGIPLPHGLGWFVQVYNGEPIAWQFGVADGASSSLTVTVPGRGLTLVLLANSSGLVRPFALEEGDLMASPFGRLFLGLLVR